MSKTSDADIDAARLALQKAAVERTFGRKQTSTKADKVRTLRTDIAKLRTQGATWAEIADVLRPTLGVGPDTIRLAISGPKSSGSKPRALRTTQKKPPPSAKPSRRMAETESPPVITPTDKKKRFGSPDL